MMSAFEENQSWTRLVAAGTTGAFRFRLDELANDIHSLPDTILLLDFLGGANRFVLRHGFAHFRKGEVLQLPNTLASDVKTFADLF